MFKKGWLGRLNPDNMKRDEAFFVSGLLLGLVVYPVICGEWLWGEWPGERWIVVPALLGCLSLYIYAVALRESDESEKCRLRDYYLAASSAAREKDYAFIRRIDSALGRYRRWADEEGCTAARLSTPEREFPPYVTDDLEILRLEDRIDRLAALLKCGEERTDLCLGIRFKDTNEFAVYIFSPSDAKHDCFVRTDASFKTEKRFDMPEIKEALARGGQAGTPGISTDDNP